MDARGVGGDPARDGEDRHKEEWTAIRLYLQSQAIWIQGILMFDKTTGQIATGILAEIGKLNSVESGSVTFSRSEVEELREVVNAYEEAVGKGWFVDKRREKASVRKLMGLSWPESKEPAA